MQDKIGVIGGMGPAATQEFYRMVTEMTNAECDQDHIDMLILSDCSMPDRTKAILSKEYGIVYDKMLADALFLQNAGCGAICITCNTAHFFADMIREKINIPIIHMIEGCAEYIKTRMPGAKTAILATDGTIKTGIYQKHMKAAGLLPFVPEPEIQKRVMYEVYDRIKKGLPADAKVWKIIEEYILDAGCETAILGCTELSVIKAELNLPDFYTDPMRIMAAKAIIWAGQSLKPEWRSRLYAEQ